MHTFIYIYMYIYIHIYKCIIYSTLIGLCEYGTGVLCLRMWYSLRRSWGLYHIRTHKTRVPCFTYRPICVLYVIYSTLQSSPRLSRPFCHIVSLNIVVNVTILNDVICVFVLDNLTLLKLVKKLHVVSFSISYLFISLWAPSFGQFYAT